MAAVAMQNGSAASTPNITWDQLNNTIQHWFQWFIVNKNARDERLLISENRNRITHLQEVTCATIGKLSARPDLFGQEDVQPLQVYYDLLQAQKQQTLSTEYPEYPAFILELTNLYELFTRKTERSKIIDRLGTEYPTAIHPESELDKIFVNRQREWETSYRQLVFSCIQNYEVFVNRLLRQYQNALQIQASIAVPQQQQQQQLYQPVVSPSLQTTTQYLANNNNHADDDISIDDPTKANGKVDHTIHPHPPGDNDQFQDNDEFSEECEEDGDDLGAE